MQAILKFNLPEDRELFEYHCKVMEYRSVINDFRNLLRGWEKVIIRLTLRRLRMISIPYWPELDMSNCDMGRIYQCSWAWTRQRKIKSSMAFFSSGSFIN
jgi:hypothetical protein